MLNRKNDLVKTQGLENQIFFLGIGAQKAGTTWLYNRLREIPTFSLLPIKELHYFDRSNEIYSDSMLYETRFFKKLFSIKWIKKAYSFWKKNSNEVDIKDKIWS